MYILARKSNNIVGGRMRNKIFLKALILGVGQVGGKIISLIFIFKLARDLKPVGLNLYTYAYIPFSLFLDLSAFGLIPGISKLVAMLDSDNKRRYVLKVGSILSIVIGIIFFILLNLFNENILGVSLYSGYTVEEYKMILNHLKLASLSLLIFPLLSFYKGYLQGYQKMLSSSICILLENIIRISLYLFISKKIDNTTISKIFICNFISYAIVLILLFIILAKEYFKNTEKFNALFSILKTTLPFGIVTLFFTFYQLIDSITLSSLGVDGQIYTSYMFETIRLIFIPIVLAQSVGGAINPKINSLCVSNRFLNAKSLALKFTTIMIYLLIPIVLIYMIYSYELYHFFYKNTDNYQVLSDISILIFFIGFYKVIIGVAQGVNKFNYVVISTFIGMIAKIALNFLLVPYYSYNGAIMATTIAIGICMMVSYYILGKSNIKILLSNIKSLFISFIIVFISIFAATIFRLTFLFKYREIVGIIGFIIIFTLCYIFLLFIIRVANISLKHKI